MIRNALLGLGAALTLGACAESSTPVLPPATATPPAASVSATSGSWVEGTYSNASGTRAYKLYVPSTYDGSSDRPLMVMLHGCSQDAYDFAAGTRMNSFAETGAFLVLYPEQSSSANTSKCWNWFSTSHQHRGSGEPSIIAGMVDQVKSGYRVDAARVGVAGLSAGAAMSVIVACTYPDRVNRLASHSGLMYRAATNLSGANSAMKNGSSANPDTRGTDCYKEMGAYAQVQPVVVFHGSSDGTVNVKNAHQTVQQWAQTDDLAYDGVDNGEIDNTSDGQSTGSDCRSYTQDNYDNSANGANVLQKYIVDGLGHAWSGGSTSGSYADPCGPDASAIIVGFFGF